MRFLKIDFEKLLKILVLLFAVTVVAVQIIICIPELNILFCRITNREYIETFSQSELVKSSEISLELIGIEPNSNIFVLLNGEEVAVFNQQNVKVVVFDNSVIEIDGRGVNKPFKVVISSSDEIRYDFDETVFVDRNIAMGGRIFID